VPDLAGISGQIGGTEGRDQGAGIRDQGDSGPEPAAVLGVTTGYLIVDYLMKR
jgi:hypothetical protein